MANVFKADSKMDYCVDKANYNSKMVTSLRDTLKTVIYKVELKLHMLMEKYLKDNLITD